MSQTEKCPVCQEELESDSTSPIVTFSCGHKMHNKCNIDCALHGVVACPCCRADLWDSTDDVLPFTYYVDPTLQRELERQRFFTEVRGKTIRKLQANIRTLQALLPAESTPLNTA